MSLPYVVGSWSVVARMIMANLGVHWRTLATRENLGEGVARTILPGQSISAGAPTCYFLVGLRGFEPPAS